MLRPTLRGRTDDPAPTTETVPVVVSLTSIPERASLVGRALASILAQERVPDEVRLHVGPGYPEVDFPGVRVVRLPVDHGPATKIAAALDPELPPNAIVVTADDDIIYEPRWLGTLVDHAAAHPSAAVAYAGWSAEELVRRGRFRFAKPGTKADVIEGWAGAAYRRRFFLDDLLPPPETFRRVDDVWISSYLARRGIPRRVVAAPMSGTSLAPGLHDRADFLELNRRACEAGFGIHRAVERPEGLRRPKLTICVPGLMQRKESLLEVLRAFEEQPRRHEVEILTALDWGANLVADKRNRLVATAAGRYVCHFDDDDLPEPRYLDAILEAIDANPGVDAILVRGRRTTNDGRSPIEFDYRLGGAEGEWIGDVIWRTPNHLCPIRTELAQAVLFPWVEYGEDLAWGELLRPHVKTAARAGADGEVLYHYRFDPTKRAP